MDAEQFFHSVILSFHPSNLTSLFPRSKCFVAWVSIPERFLGKVRILFVPGSRWAKAARSVHSRKSESGAAHARNHGELLSFLPEVAFGAIHLFPALPEANRSGHARVHSIFVAKVHVLAGQFDLPSSRFRPPLRSMWALRVFLSFS